jgi:hypothetical protein
LGELVDIPERHWPGMEVLDLKGCENYHFFLQELLKLTYLLHTYSMIYSSFKRSIAVPDIQAHHALSKTH